jgi:ribosomal protein S18 acetylase RimI-like enzyme
MTVRRATASDIPRIKEIRSAVRENRLSDPSRVTDADVAWSIENGPMFVFEEGTVVSGFSAPDPRDGSIWALFVDPEHEGRGIGKALLDRAERRLIEQGCENAWLTTDPGTRADRFYRKRGWIESGKKGNEVLFRKQLKP